MLLIETITYWTGVLGYALSFALYTIGISFSKRNLLNAAFSICKLAFILHTISIIIRWLYSGHPPFVTYFESISASAWFGILGFLFLEYKRNRFNLVGLITTGIVFMLLGWASTPQFAGEGLGAGLRSVWLFIHATFATASVGLFLVAAGLNGTWLWKNNKKLKKNIFVSEISEKTIITDLGLKYILVGFLFYTIMLLSGAIWANNAWGRYWAWDPIETWSLITWVVYGLYLHIYFTVKKLRGRFTAWYSIIAVIFAAFSLWGVRFVYSTIHNYG